MEKDEVIIMCEIQEITKCFLVEYYLIWFDPTNLSQIYKDDVQKLKNTYELKISASWKDVNNQMQKEKTTYHLIISGVPNESLLKEIENISNISFIFIFSQNFPASLDRSKYPKIKSIETNITNLLSKIDEHIVKWQREDSSLRKEFPAFAPIFDDYDKSKMNYRHYYLQGFTNFQNRAQAKKDFIHLAKKIDQNKDELKNFDRNYNDYKMERILHWYTKPGFVYKITNNCLRIASSDSIQYCRFILKDLEIAIREEFKSKSKSFHGILYRGAFVTSQEWDQLEKNVGRDIEMHGFLSTSKAERVALNFVKANPDQKALITIIVPRCSDKEEQGFVDIQEYSEFKDEEEILFNVRSRFTILHIGSRLFQSKQCRHLVLLYGKQAWKIDTHQNEKAFRIDIEFTARQKCSFCEKDIESSQSKFFASLTHPIQYFCELCFESSSKFQKDYQPLFYLDPKKKNTLSTQKKLVVSIEGKVLFQFGDKRVPFYGYKCSGCQKTRRSAAFYFKCLSCPNNNNLWCKKCQGCQQETHTMIVERSGFSFWSEKLSPQEKDFFNYQLQQQNDVFHQGEIFFKGQEYPKAKQYYEKIIKQQQYSTHNNQIHRAYHGLGLVNKELGDLNSALTYFNKAISLQKILNPNPDAQAAKSYHELGVTYKILGDFDLSKQYYQKGLDIREALYSTHHQEIAESYDGIAWAYEALGDFEQAIFYYQKGLDMFRHVYGENHPLTAKSYNNLATVYSTQANNKKSIEYYEKALEIDKLVLGDFHPDTALVYSSLGVEYSKGIDLNKSKEYLNRSIEILRAIYGDHNQYIIVPYNNLATVYMDSGRYSEALELYKKTLEIGIDVCGENNPGLILYYENLASAFLKLQNIDKAAKYLFKCFSIIQAVFPTEKHPEIASYYCKLAELYRESHDYELALEYNYKSLEIYKSIFGETHPHVGACYHNLAIIYMIQFEYQKAEEFYLKNIETSKEVYCEHNIDLAMTYGSLALIYQRMGNFINCIEYNEKALVIYDAFYGPEHVNTATCYNQMGACFRSMGDLEKALEYHKIALRIYKASFTDSENYEEIAMSYDLLGVTYKEMLEFHQALEYHEKCFSIRKMIETIAPYKIGESMVNIGQVHQRLGDSSKAVEYFTKVTSRTGEDDVNTCHAYGGLGLIYYQQKKYKKSREYFEKSLNLSLKFFGENHEQTAIKYWNWATAEVMCGDYKKAEILLLKSLKIKQETFGEDHPRLISDYIYISQLYQFLKNKEKAAYFSQMAENIEHQQAGI